MEKKEIFTQDEKINGFKIMVKGEEYRIQKLGCVYGSKIIKLQSTMGNKKAEDINEVEAYDILLDILKTSLESTYPDKNIIKDISFMQATALTEKLILINLLEEN